MFASSALDARSLPRLKSQEDLWSQHCQQVAKDPELMIKKLGYYKNRLSFLNDGGIGNAGVCWWHSRLTRIAQYMAVFNPDLPQLSEDEAYFQVHRLRQGKPTTFNGFANFYEFSLVHKKAIQDVLEEWQVINGGFQFGFLDGLRGSTSLPPDEYKAMMDETYELFQRTRKPIYQMLQVPGITAHAWILIDIVRTTTGYKYEVIDSNYSFVMIRNYIIGERHYSDFKWPMAIPYTTRSGLAEEKLLSDRLSDICSSSKRRITAIKNSDQWPDLDDQLLRILGN